MNLRLGSLWCLVIALCAVASSEESRAQAPSPLPVVQAPLGVDPAPVPTTNRTLWRSAWGALAGLSIGYGILHDDIRVVCSAPLDGGACPVGRVVSESSTRPHLTAGLVGGGLALAAGWFFTRGDSGTAGGTRGEVELPMVAPRVLNDGSLSLLRIPLGGAR